MQAAESFDSFSKIIVINILEIVAIFFIIPNAYDKNFIVGYIYFNRFNNIWSKTNNSQKKYFDSWVTVTSSNKDFQ